MSWASIWLTVIALGSVAGCTGARREAGEPDPALARSAADLDAANRTLFVIATRDKPRIIESLEAAGIPVAMDLLDAGFLLRVTVGAGQGGQSCGTRHNVKYSLRREGAAVLELVEKGYLGTCTPHVFDLLSRRLAGALASGNGLQRGPRQP